MHGPMEYLVVSFPGNKFKGEIAPELKRLVVNDTIKIIDLLIVKKGKDGVAVAIELEEMAPEEAEEFAELYPDVDDIVTDTDVDEIGVGLEPNSSAAILVIEHLWATRLKQTIENAGGILVANERLYTIDSEAATTAAE